MHRVNTKILSYVERVIIKMKTNIKKDGRWWSWIEICDRCREVISDEDWGSTEEPNIEEVDFCIHCLKYFLRANIPYNFAIKLYRNNRENKK